MKQENRPYEGILLCSDFDGTLGWGGTIPEVNINAIKDFCAKGGKFTISSGRGADFLLNAAAGLCNAPLICINGTQIYDTESEQVLWQSLLDDQALLPYQDSDIPQGKYIEIVQAYAKSGPFLTFENVHFERYENLPILKVVTAYESVKDCINAQAQLSAKYPAYQWCRSWPVGLEQISPEGGKGVCVNWLRNYLGVKTVIAIGDFENDATMLKAADITFAPLNADESIKAISQFTTVHAEEGALADLIAKLPSILSPNF